MAHTEHFKKLVGLTVANVLHVDPYEQGCEFEKLTLTFTDGTTFTIESMGYSLNAYFGVYPRR